MSTTLSTASNFKRTWLQVFLWTRLLFQSLCDNVWTGGSTSELGIFGSPAFHVSTITITTTLAYNPSLAPQGSMFSLLGCYSRGAGSPEGNLFGKDGDDYAVPTKVPPDKLTISACLEACTALIPPKKTSDHYGLVGLSNGSECFCGLELVAEARKLTLGACDMPCTGDSTLSCGGRDTVAVYRFVAASEGNTVTNKGNSQDDSYSSDVGDESKTAPLGVSLSSVIDPNAFLKATDATEPTETETLGESQEATDKAAMPSSPPLPSSSSDAPDQSAKGSTIAAVTGSISGAVILAAFIVLCVKYYKRKKLQQAAHRTEVVPEKQHGKDHDKQLPRRPIPSAIDTTGRQLLGSETEPERVAKDERARARGHAKRDEDLAYLGSSGPSASDGAYFVPTTPALESGTRLRHPEHSSARLSIAPSPSSDRDTLYNRLLDEVRSGPVFPAPSPSPSGPSLQPPQQPPSSATSSAVQWRNQPPLTPSAGSAAQFDFDFHNASAKTATVPSPVLLPVPPAARPEAPLGDRAWHRRKISAAFQPPASGPPSMPLPPTPPRRTAQEQQQRFAELSRLSLTPSPAPRGKTSTTGGGKKKGPRVSAVPKALPLGIAESASQGASTRRMSAPQSPALKDSPTMPRGRRDSQYPRRAGAAQGGVEEVGMQPLPPRTPDSRSSRGTIYTVGEENLGGDGSGSVAGGEELSPSSVSTVGTSILFPSDDEGQS
ncbi:uncharacterized protein F4812DRAFT_11945 [Daldinia caldariorum]|uniref:uncharacterized protein n=1 Tax=Daldinia caldariorum TaxID=326644 RepID=UPI0020079FE7|nr:uncharacterized protein F4812DRAFT_11945 [Daldinia caldariorum]KAI1472411.1 hypothetical protein F4812DRAFT_11945 [Daldinia caldariorum]